MSYFQATDGTTLYYREYGDGRPIVLLASQGLSSSMWQHLMVRLADQGFRCVALDRRGHGRSDDPGKGYDFDRFAAVTWTFTLTRATRTSTGWCTRTGRSSPTAR
jgi:pimeloyl-ACP methyl ester carboxylesterase